MGKAIVPTIRSAIARFTKKKFPNLLSRRDLVNANMAATLLRMMATATVAYVTHQVITFWSTLRKVEFVKTKEMFIPLCLKQASAAAAPAPEFACEGKGSIHHIFTIWLETKKATNPLQERVVMHNVATAEMLCLNCCVISRGKTVD